MNILITGACGFIGRRLIQELEQHGHSLRLLDKQRPQEATMFVPGSPERAYAPFVTAWSFLQADIMDDAAMVNAVAGVDAVVHLAASPTGLPEVGVQTFSFNAVGTFTLLDACRKQGVSRFVTASSINAYGTFYWRLNQTPVEYPELPLTESFPPVPQDPYSLSKLVNEETCAAFHRAYGIKTAALRFGAVWSDDMYDKALTEGLRETTSWSDDLYTWVHIQDIVIGIRQAMEAAELPGHGVYTLNAADTRCPEPTMDLLKKFRPDYVDRLVLPIEGRASLISTAAATDAFGYQPQYRLDDAPGIR